MNIVSYDTSKIDNYPENCEELGNKWYNENYTEFKIGDKVQFIYTLNRDGNTSEQINLYEDMKKEQPIGTISGFEIRKSKINIYDKKCKFLKVEFEDSKFNVANELVDLIPMQFIKVN